MQILRRHLVTINYAKGMCLVIYKSICQIPISLREITHIERKLEIFKQWTVLIPEVVVFDKSQNRVGVKPNFKDSIWRCIR